MREFEKQYNGHPVRIIDMDGNPWFVAKDVCDVLGIKRQQTALRHLNEDEKGVMKKNTPSGKKQVPIVSEPGFYSMIFHLHTPEAMKFQHWVMNEALPPIFNHNVTADIVELLKNVEAVLKLLQETNEQLENENARLREKIDSAMQTKTLQNVHPRIVCGKTINIINFNFPNHMEAKHA